MNEQNQITKNFTRKECECPHCGTLPSISFVNRLQGLRNEYGKPMRVSSMYRCPAHNRAIKGYGKSVHMVLIEGAGYGAADIKTGRYNNTMRWELITLALKHGFNNIEVCNLHTHIGRVPPTHSGYDKIIWGVSK